MTKVILSCFAGRKKNLQVLFRYVDRLLETKLVDEFHVWNFTRDHNDEAWLRSELGSKSGIDNKVFTVFSEKYVKLPWPTEFGDRLTLYVRAQRDVHVALVDRATGKTAYEIVLGGWSNAKSVVRSERQGTVLLESPKRLSCGSAFDKFELVRRDGMMKVSLGGDLFFEIPGVPVDAVYDVEVAAWNNKVEWCADELHATKHESKKLFNVNNKKSWLEYYRHYSEQRYPDSVLIKCDDDITFIDTEGFSRFIRHRIDNPEYLLSFPSIVNNGVCAHYQQQAGLLPDSLGEFPYQTVCGKLWESGALCESLHRHFIGHHREFLEMSAALPEPLKAHKIGDRISINFFAVLSRDFKVLQEIGRDDERELSIRIPLKYRRAVCVDMSFVVSHLAFYQQRTTGLNEDAVIEEYARLADAWLV
jgi:Farnesoic acid 0-methyl transferase